jgi:ribosomal subunit interface protein
MEKPLEITFRGLDPSEAIENNIRDRAAKLERFFSDIMSMQVVVEAPHKHQHKGKHYRVLVDIMVPDKEIVANRSPDDNAAHEDAYVAIRDAFEAAQRQLEAYRDRRTGNVKARD